MRLCLTLVLAAVLLGGIAAGPGDGHAQQQPAPPQAEPSPRAPLGLSPPPASQRGLTAGRPAAAPDQRGPAAPVAVGTFAGAYQWLERQQAYFRQVMSSAVRSMRTEPFGAAFLSLMGICFAYGVLHAAGPGHGKGVISAYALANNETVRRGIALSFLAALFQAFSAIAIFLVLSLALSARKSDFDRVEGWLETASWALIAGLGAWLLIARLGSLLRARTRPLAAGAHHHAHDHSHVHAHDHAHDQTHVHRHPHAHGHAHAAAHGHHHPHQAAPDAALHRHAHADACDHCGHMHMPTPQQVAGAWSWPKALGIAASVGIRPCTGALILLAFCAASGLLWAGILGTLLMSLGTAITISTLAALAVGSRDALSWLGGGNSAWTARVGTAAGLVGSALVFVMGSAFFVMSLKGPAPF